jgi:DNA-binding MarR family transcriptional regulator
VGVSAGVDIGIGVGAGAATVAEGAGAAAGPDREPTALPHAAPSSTTARTPTGAERDSLMVTFPCGAGLRLQGSAAAGLRSSGRWLANEIHVDENLVSKISIPYALGVDRDWIDRVVERWLAIDPGLDMGPYRVTGRISRIAMHITRRQEEVFGRYGLNRGDVGVLGALRTAGPPHRLSPTQLLRGLMLSSAGMTGRLDRLAERGLVERHPDPGDRRAVLVELTAKGRELVDAAVASNTRAERELLDGLGEREAESLARLLRRLLARLEDPSGA